MIEGEDAAFRRREEIRRWWDDLHVLYEDLAATILTIESLGGGLVVVEFEVAGHGAEAGSQHGAARAGRDGARGQGDGARDFASREQAFSAATARPG
jgi:hypothetical protein